MSAKAIGPLTGILFVVLAIVAFLVGGETPSTDDSPEEIVDFYLDNDDPPRRWHRPCLLWDAWR
jgi:hypothetical protein